MIIQNNFSVWVPNLSPELLHLTGLSSVLHNCIITNIVSAKFGFGVNARKFSILVELEFLIVLPS
jgi:hypothetical protein